MLDTKLNPWLLEVNLSPACAERTPWLVNMLDRMADGLFDLIESKFTKISDDFKGPLRNYLLTKRKFEPKDNWNCIYKEKRIIDRVDPDVRGNKPLEVYSLRMNPRIEKKVGVLYQ